MSNLITVPCQYASATPCGNKTTSHTGLCPKHRNKVPLKDIHGGKGKPLLTAIPRVGPVITSSLTYTTDSPATNEELAEKIKESEDRKKYAKPSVLTRLMHPRKVSEWKAKVEREWSDKRSAESSYQINSAYGRLDYNPSFSTRTSAGKNSSNGSTNSSNDPSISQPMDYNTMDTLGLM